MKLLSERILACTIFADIAYRSKMIYRKDGIDHDEVEGMKKLFSTTDFPTGHKVREYQYKAHVWINEKEKEIICASSGTRLMANIKELTVLSKIEQFLTDFLDNVKIIKGDLSIKINAISSLNDVILEKLAEKKGKLSDWKIIYTGHCTGGNLATTGSIDMYFKTHSRDSHDKGPEIASIVFEGLGANNQAQKLYDINKESDPEQLDIKHYIINNRDNLANLVCPKLETGKIYQIIVPNKHEASFEGTLNWISDIVSPILEANKPYIEELQRLCKPFYSRILDKVYSQIQGQQDDNYKIEQVEQSKLININNTCKAIYQNFINPLFVKCTKILFPENIPLVKKIQEDGIIYSFLETFLGQHRSAQLFSNMESKDPESVNGIKTSFTRLIDGKANIPHDAKLLEKYNEKLKSDSICSDFKCNDIVMENGSEEPIPLCSQIIGSIGYNCEVRDLGLEC